MKGPFEKGGVYRADLVVPGVGLGRRPRTGPWFLSGTVLDDVGRPVDGARPTGRWIEKADDWPARTRADGFFECFAEVDLSEVDPGKPLVTLWAEGHVPCSRILSAQEIDTLRLTGRLDGLRLTMDRTASLAVRVVDETGAPVEEAWAAVTTDPYSRTACLHSEDPRDPPPPDTVGDGSTDGRGEARIDGLDAGTPQYLLAWKDGRTPSRVPLEGRLAPGESTAVEVVLPRMQTVPSW